MFKGRLIFPSILLLLFVMSIESDHFFPIILFAVCFIKLCFYKQTHLVILFVFLASIIAINEISEKNNGINSQTDINSAMIEVKQTTWSIDGDQLKFQGHLTSEQISEEVVIRYTIDSEEEKRELLSSIPSFLLVEGEVRVPHSQSNFNQFDYQLFLNRQNINYIMYAKELSEIEAPYTYFSQYYRFDSVRQKLLRYCDRMYSPIISRYMKAFIFGDKRELSDDVTSAFKNLGIIHLLSISGLHISLLIVMSDKLLTRLTVTRESIRLIHLVLLPSFGLFSGFGISVFRAVVQAWVRCFSDFQKWDLTSLDCWSIAFVSALIINPAVIYSIGFQLSYTMSFILLFVSQLSFFQDYSLWKQMCLLTIALFISSVPILSFHYYEFSMGVLILNSFYIPFVSYVIMPGLLFLFLISPLKSVSPFFSLLDKAMELILTSMEEITTGIDKMMSMTFISGRLSATVIIIWIVLIIAGLILLEQKKSNSFLISTAAMFILLLQINKYSPLGHIIMIDVGQGDAILIKEPFNRGNHLIDTGGSVQWGTDESWQIQENEFTLGKNVVLPVLKSFGIDRLDSIIITHPHRDHYGEIAEIANGVTVNHIVLNNYTFSHSSVKEELLKINDYSIVVENIDADSKNVLPENVFYLKDEWVDDDNLNNQSIVLIGKYGKLVWLFTGDIEKEREISIMSQYPELKADVLKVSHHGGATSTHDAFLSQIDPDYALISVGKGNRYGHPNQETVDQLSYLKNSLYRTDSNGSIRYTYSDSSLINRWLIKDDPFKTIK